VDAVDAVDPTDASPMPAAEVAMPAFGGLRPRDERELADFRACLEKNVRHLRRYPSRGITCYRVYDRDQVDVPLIIDLYEGRAHVAEYEREHSRSVAQQADWYDAVRRIVAEATGASRVVIKEKHRQRGLTQHEKVAESGESFLVQEDGLRFEVNLDDYIDTGLFLDHRLTRAMVRDKAAGARFLNLFCYTGAFTTYAAAGRNGRGAASTTSVDLSNTYLEWTMRNLRHNGLYPGPHRLVRSDVLEFLREHPRGEHYDLAVIDPPTFSNSKSTEEDWEVAVGHAEVLGLVRALLSPRASVWFSTNYRRFKLDEEALAACGYEWTEISHRTVPPEYRNRRIHRCWLLRPAGEGGASE
jgi:23S rRNA G2069 N7-methylase RlmK/C1962 C5-methylase RlmI